MKDMDMDIMCDNVTSACDDTSTNSKKRSCAVSRTRVIHSPNDKLIATLNNYFNSNSVNYDDFCKISVNTRFDKDGNIIGDSGSSRRSDIPSLIQDIISVYSDNATICYIVNSNNIITGVTWTGSIRNPTL